MSVESILDLMLGPDKTYEDTAKITTQYNTSFNDNGLYKRFNVGADACILNYRPDGAPSIIEELKVSPENPLKIMMYQHQSPGDIIMLTAAIRDLHKAFPKHFITGVDASVQEIFENNPYVAELDRHAPDVLHMHCTYTRLIAQSCTINTHFIYSFVDEFEQKLGLRIPLTKGQGEVFLTAQEKKWSSRVWELLQAERPYWIVDAGRKSDFTSKLWAVDRFQAVVDAFPHVTFVQIGAGNEDHYHPPLTGDNLISEVGKTNVRQLIRLMYHAAGVITPVSFPMHLCPAVEVHPRYRFKHRPCIVLAGAREPSSWEAYNTHSYIHNCGIMPCAGNGGCWKARIERLGDGDQKDNDLCTNPVKLESGQTIPKCLDMITADHVIEIMQQYLDAYP